MIRACQHTHQRAFSLVEMSVVLGIVALLLGFGMTLGTNAIKSADRVSVQQKLAILQEALDNYANTHGYLPCPASRTQSPTSNPGTFGFENRSGTTTCAGPGIAASGNAYIGMVPVRTLGLPDAYAGDAWSNKITYAVSQPHIGSSTSYTASNGTITVNMGDRSGTWYPVTSATTNRTAPHNDTRITYGPGATYVLVSHGPDGRGSYPLKGTAQSSACNAGSQNDVENCNDDNVFWDTTYNDTAANPSQYFDDFIVWGSNVRKRAPVQGAAPAFSTSCSGACESWCAPCLGGTPNLPVGAPGNITAPTLCSKIITSTSPCYATCVWSGVNTSGEIVRCP